MLHIVAGTREGSLESFSRDTLLGQSLRKYSSSGTVAVARTYRELIRGYVYLNPTGLPNVFNEALSAADEADSIIFTHDDVRIDDWHLLERLSDAFQRFDVVGVAGNRRRLPRQRSWAFTDTEPEQATTWDTQENLSGAVGGFPKGGFETISYFGESPSEVKLLDGLFLAAKVKTLRQADVQFDSRFHFHFYDLDFCRTCEARGLRLGTWPIAVSHGSRGALRSPDWKVAYNEYLTKWNEH